MSSFPINRLCYDLVLEVIDKLDPEDVLKLMRVDKRFRSVLFQKPGRIFGKQIHWIDIKLGENWDAEAKIWDGPIYIIRVTEFPGSTPRYPDVLFLSRVERCSVLTISQVECDEIDEKELSALKKVFANLKQVGELDVMINDGNNFDDCLENLKAEVTDRASLKIYHRTKEAEQQFLLSLIGGRLQNCKMISLETRELYPTAYSALSKTQLELSVIQIWPENVGSAIELILKFGIPSENKEAACFVQWLETVEINSRIKNIPEIRHVNEQNKTFIVDTMMEMLRKQEDDFVYCYPSGGSVHCYSKRIDEKRDCIYSVNDYFLFAKYVSSIQ